MYLLNSSSVRKEVNFNFRIQKACNSTITTPPVKNVFVFHPRLDYSRTSLRQLSGRTLSKITLTCPFSRAISLSEETSVVLPVPPINQPWFNTREEDMGDSHQAKFNLLQSRCITGVPWLRCQAQGLPLARPAPDKVW